MTSNMSPTGKPLPQTLVADSAADDFYLIGELQPLVGLEPKTIRFYERAGLASPKRHGRIRTYRMSDVQRLKAIKYLRQFGVSIAMIRDILQAQGELSMSTIGSAQVQSLLGAHLKVMKQKYETLNAQIDELSAMVEPQDKD